MGAVTEKIRALRSRRPRRKSERPAAMSAEKFRRIRLMLGVSQARLGELLGRGALHVSSLETGRARINASTANHMLALEELAAAVGKTQDK